MKVFEVKVSVEDGQAEPTEGDVLGLLGDEFKSGMISVKEIVDDPCIGCIIGQGGPSLSDSECYECKDGSERISQEEVDEVTNAKE